MSEPYEVKELVRVLENRITAGLMRPIKEQIVDSIRWEGWEVSDEELTEIFQALNAID